MVGNSDYVFHDPFLGTDSVPILQLMLSEIDFGNYAAFFYLADSLFKMCIRRGHCPRFGGLKRLPRLFCGRRWNWGDGKCVKGSGQDLQLAITRKGWALQTQKGRTGNDLWILAHFMFCQLVVHYCYEPKYASKTCFAMLNPSSERI